MDHDRWLIEATGGGQIAGFDWGKVQPYVMFITGRCGSTWLADLLANTGRVGNPQEWLNSEIVPYSGVAADTLPDYFAGVVRRHSPGNWFGLQLDPERLEDTLHLVDWDTVFPAATTPTFFMYRRDLLSQAWSWVRAEKSGYWHTPDPDDPDDQDRPVLGPEHEPTMRELADRIVAIRRQEEYLFAFWAERGYRPVFIEYESLVVDAAETVGVVLRELGVSSDVADTGSSKRAPLPYDESRAAGMERFIKANRLTMEELQGDRFGVSADFLADRFTPGVQMAFDSSRFRFL